MLSKFLLAQLRTSPSIKAKDLEDLFSWTILSLISFLTSSYSLYREEGIKSLRSSSFSEGILSIYSFSLCLSASELLDSSP